VLIKSALPSAEKTRAHRKRRERRLGLRRNRNFVLIVGKVLEERDPDGSKVCRLVSSILFSKSKQSKASKSKGQV